MAGTISFSFKDKKGNWQDFKCTVDSDSLKEIPKMVMDKFLEKHAGEIEALTVDCIRNIQTDIQVEHIWDTVGEKLDLLIKSLKDIQVDPVEEKSKPPVNKNILPKKGGNKFHGGNNKWGGNFGKGAKGKNYNTRRSGRQR